MKKQLIYFFSFLILFIACKKDDPIKSDKTDGTFRRTVLLYIIGDNTLSNYVNTNINGIIQSVQDADLYNNNFLIYVDDKSESNYLISLRKDEQIGVYRDTVAIFPDRNSASVEALNEIIAKVEEEYKSEKYGLLLWGHGTGWLPSTWYPTRAYGDDRREFFELSDLEKAIPDNMFDFILFDACFMASCEVAYELRNKADYLIASSAEIMGAGFPYSKVGSLLLASSPAFESVCNAFYETYQAESGGNQTATISWIDMKQMGNLASVTKSILFRHQSSAASLDLSIVQRFDRSSIQNVVYDLEDYVSKFATGEELNDFQLVLDKTVLYEASTDRILNMFDVKTHCGLTHYPYYTLISQKPNFELNDSFKETGWYRVVYE